MKINNLYFLIYFLVLTSSFAQKEANIRITGDNVGIDFNYNRFTPFNGTGMKQFGASASICDSEIGQLVFYTDGKNVWNKNFELMPNGTELRGGYSTTQAALIVPNPGNESLY